MKTTQIKLKKISCGSCNAIIYRALTCFEGIRKVSIESKNNSVTISFDDEKMTDRKIKKILDIIGLEYNPDD